jgi:alpha-L-arabinofuranosidase
MISRRTMLGVSTVGLATSVLCPWSLTTASSSRATIDILLNESLGSISPDLYGYLLENLGTVIYDGVWVGEGSKIPNVGGIRKDLIDCMRTMTASVIRWPGGNFADYYDWTDGVGPAGKRPRRTNIWSDEMAPQAVGGPQSFDPNSFGTPEFMRLCKLSGGVPFLSANVRALSPQDFARWVEYCNSPTGSTTLADARKADGSTDPYNVRYWGIGNEVWEAGGLMSVEEYSALYRRFTAVPHYGLDLAFVACGPPPPFKGTRWITDFLALCRRKPLYAAPVFAISLHYYANEIANDMAPGQTITEMLRHDYHKRADDESLVEDYNSLLPDPMNFGIDEWYEVLANSLRIEELILSCWEEMGYEDPERKLKLSVDEWATLYKGGSELNPRNIRGRTMTLRDAIAAALTLDTFQRHCDKVAVANFTGLINQEGGLFQAEEERFITTPIYHVFCMYAPHKAGKSLRALFQAPRIDFKRNGKANSLPSLSGSASVRNNVLTLTVVNADVRMPQDAEVSLHGAIARSATITTLTHDDMHARNTFDNPRHVFPTTKVIDLGSPKFHYTFPPASVTRFSLSL